MIKSCYNYIHNPVCKYWGNWEKPFLYIDDSKIGPYFKRLVETLSCACALYTKRENQNGQ
jgi:hypothetical protein